MGVPVVALQGNSPVARQSASILTALDLKDWVATDIDGCVERAVTLSESGLNYSARKKLLARRSHSVFDAKLFTLDLIQAIDTACDC
jgi:predicted O-linked N-acetylglucosamine transferase (SPINDLY family)